MPPWRSSKAPLRGAVPGAGAALHHARRRVLRVAHGARKKDPFLIKLADQELFGFAALWDRTLKPDGEAIESCVIITLPGNELMRRIHNTGAHPFRMPAPLAKEDREQWLTGSAAEAASGNEAIPAGMHARVSGQHASQQSQK